MLVGESLWSTGEGGEWLGRVEVWLVEVEGVLIQVADNLFCFKKQRK